MVTGKIHDERSFALAFVSLKMPVRLNFSTSKAMIGNARPSTVKDALAEVPARGVENNRDAEAFRERQLRASETCDNDIARQLDSFASHRDIGRMGLILKQTR